MTEQVEITYQRGLSARNVQMMALGGAIGTGLFYGAGGAIEKAGPALIVAYLAAGLVAYVVMRALGELLIYRPVSGGLSEFPRQFLGPFAGFAVGWTYWAVWATTCMAEITVAGKYINYWWPSIPVWLTALVALLVLFALNLLSVKFFGETEFWFAAIKITAILGMIIVGAGVLLPIAGLGPEHGPSLTNLWNDGGFFATGVSSALLSLQVVFFAYGGIELISVTAEEAENPKVTLRKAINTLPFRIGLFYIGALFVILTVRGWWNFQAGESPFVAVFSYIGIPGAAGIINFVLLTAALSSCNSGIYTTGRMLRSLAQQGDAPARISQLSKGGVPVVGIVVSALFMAGGVVVNIVDPRRAFVYITSISTFGFVAIWASILLCHMLYRRQVKLGNLLASDYRLPGAPLTTAAALAFLALVIGLLSANEEGRTALMIGGVWIMLVSVGFVLLKRRNQGLMKG